MDWNCFYAFLCHDGWKLTEGKKIWLYQRVGVCVRKSITFSPSPFLFWELHNLWFSKATTLLLLLTTHILAHRHSWQHGCRLLWSRGCPMIYHQGDISQRVSLKYSSDPLNGKCGLNDIWENIAILGNHSGTRGHGKLRLSWWNPNSKKNAKRNWKKKIWQTSIFCERALKLHFLRCLLENVSTSSTDCNLSTAPIDVKPT